MVVLIAICRLRWDCGFSWFLRVLLVGAFGGVSGLVWGVLLGGIDVCVVGF